VQNSLCVHLRTIAQVCRAICSQLRDIWRIGKNLLNSNNSSTCPHNMVNFGPLTVRYVVEFGAPGHPCKFQRVSRLSSITARHSSGGRQPNCGVEQRAPPVFGRAAIMGIVPHSTVVLSCFFLLFYSSPNLDRRGLDICHRPTSTPDVALLRI